MLRANSKAQVTAGIFEVAGMAYGAMNDAGMLGKGTKVPTTKEAKTAKRVSQGHLY